MNAAIGVESEFNVVTSGVDRLEAYPGDCDRHDAIMRVRRQRAIGQEQVIEGVRRTHRIGGINIKNGSALCPVLPTLTLLEICATSDGPLVWM